MTKKKRTRRTPARKSQPSGAAPSTPATPVPASQPSTPPQPTAPSADALQKAAVDELLTKLEKARERPAIVYWTSQVAKVSMGVELTLLDQLINLPTSAELDLVLFTYGGDTEAPSRIIDLIREYSKHLTVLIPHVAQSSGTLIAIGADEIQMTPLGTLGPIDPSRVHPLLPRRKETESPEPVSVQDMRHAMEFIREAVGPDATPSPQDWAQIFTSLFDKIHPLAIGAIEQSYALAKLIARHNLGTHLDQKSDKKKISEIIDKLCDSYKSHQYRIGRKEAAEIGLNAVSPRPEVETILFDLLKHYNSRPIVPGMSGKTKPGDQVTSHIAWLDSTRLKRRCEQTSIVGDQGKLSSQRDRWVTY